MIDDRGDLSIRERSPDLGMTKVSQRLDGSGAD
jgi:hypothetical protein